LDCDPSWRESARFPRLVKLTQGWFLTDYAFLALEYIIEANPQVATWKDKGGVTALQLAALQRSEGPVRLLLLLLPGSSCDAHAKDQALLFALAKSDPSRPLIPVMDALVEGATLTSCDDRGRNALSLAARSNQMRAVGKILDIAGKRVDDVLKAMLTATDGDGRCVLSQSSHTYLILLAHFRYSYLSPNLTMTWHVQDGAPQPFATSIDNGFRSSDQLWSGPLPPLCERP
jgi:hypothetical protein